MEEETLNNYLKAGKIAAEAREYGRALVKPGVSILEVAEQIEAKIRSLGGKPAFPVNISFNDTAAHYTPAPNDTILFDDQVVKLMSGCMSMGLWVVTPL
ncbi:MAG: M24 family metallopeptidase [Candidatus Woesearchaeota archaeon]